MKPRRIQLRRTKGWRMPANTVKVDRTTQWGNPFRVGLNCCENGDYMLVGSAQVVAAFRDWITNKQDPDALAAVRRVRKELRGKNLACWCKPGEPCHADVLLELANPSPRGTARRRGRR